MFASAFMIALIRDGVAHFLWPQFSSTALPMYACQPPSNSIRDPWFVRSW